MNVWRLMWSAVGLYWFFMWAIAFIHNEPTAQAFLATEVACFAMAKANR